MDFGQALQELKAGNRVERAGWNGNIARTGFVPPSRKPVVFDGLCYILLSSGDVAFCDSEDFDAVSVQENWSLSKKGYPYYTAYSEGKAKSVKLHQVIFPEESMVDHANGNRLDNRRRNLRPCTSAENNANRAGVDGHSSKYKGVTWDKSRGKWMAAICSEGKSRTLGRFSDEIEAAKAYDAAAKEAHGEFARLNFQENRMWVALMPGYPDGVPANEATAVAHRVPVGSLVVVRPYLVMRAADGSLVNWTISQSDALAEDWSTVTPEG